MVKFEDVKGYLYYYAYRLRSNRFEADELINEAWIAIRKIEIPQFYSKAVLWAMCNYKNREYSRDSKGTSKTIIIHSIDQELSEELFMKNLLAADQIDMDKGLEINLLIRSHKLSLEDKLLIDQRFFRNLTLAQIGVINGVTKECIRQRLKVLLNKLRGIV